MPRSAHTAHTCARGLPQHCIHRNEPVKTQPAHQPAALACAGVRPTCGTPPSTAMVAGTAPCARTTPSTCLAVSRFWGYGMPCEMMVLSSATTGRPAASAAATSALTVTPAAVGACGRRGVTRRIACYSIYIVRQHRHAQEAPRAGPHLNGGGSRLQFLGLLLRTDDIGASQVAGQQRDAVLPGRVRHCSERCGAVLEPSAGAMIFQCCRDDDDCKSRLSKTKAEAAGFHLAAVSLPASDHRHHAFTDLHAHLYISSCSRSSTLATLRTHCPPVCCTAVCSSPSLQHATRR